MKCANCGTESKGNFCPSCGANMRAGKCGECGAAVVPGARFCTSCGAETGGGAGGRGGRRDRTPAPVGESSNSNLPWYIAGAVLLVLLFVLVTPMIMGEDNRVPDRGSATFGGQAGPGGLAPLTGSPREQADRLFNRVMAAREAGDMAEALQFAPMGVQAYQMAEPLDDDGLYHLATLQNTASDFNGALQTAERILSRNPDHLLGLASAAEAAEGAGDAAAARQYHQRLLDAYETEIGRNLPEYMDHARILPEYRQAAQRAVAQGG